MHRMYLFVDRVREEIVRIHCYEIFRIDFVLEKDFSEENLTKYPVEFDRVSMLEIELVLVD